jgi:hypothetical protein
MCEVFPCMRTRPMYGRTSHIWEVFHRTTPLEKFVSWIKGRPQRSDGRQLRGQNLADFVGLCDFQVVHNRVRHLWKVFPYVGRLLIYGKSMGSRSMCENSSYAWDNFSYMGSLRQKNSTWRVSIMDCRPQRSDERQYRGQKRCWVYGIMWFPNGA